MVYVECVDCGEFLGSGTAEECHQLAKAHNAAVHNDGTINWDVVALPASTDSVN